MSEIERFNGPLIGFEMQPGERGDYVRYSNYATLRERLAEVERERDEAQTKFAFWLGEHDREIAERRAAEADNKRLRSETIEECEVAAWEYLRREAPDRVTLRGGVLRAIRALASETAGGGE